MLGKLLKYELRATGRIFLPLYALLLLTSAVFRIFELFNFTYIKVIISILLGSLFVAMCVITLLLLIQRFYKNLLGDEGYLMFTLPVNTASLIWSKLIGFVVWAFFSVSCAMLSAAILTFNSSTPRMFVKFFSDLFYALSHAGFSDYLFAFQLILTGAVSVCSSILMIYAAMAIGQLAGSRRALVSLGAYFGLMVAVQTVFGIGMYILTKISPDLEEFLNMLDFGVQANGLMFCILLINAALGTIYFVITHQILHKKLNLE